MSEYFPKPSERPKKIYKSWFRSTKLFKKQFNYVKKQQESIYLI